VKGDLPCRKKSPGGGKKIIQVLSSKEGEQGGKKKKKTKTMGGKFPLGRKKKVSKNVSSLN